MSQADYDNHLREQIAVLQKIYEDDCEHSTYYIGGTLVVDVPDNMEKDYIPFTLFNVRNICTECDSDLEREKQALISKIYLSHKSGSHTAQATLNVQAHAANDYSGPSL